MKRSLCWSLTVLAFAFPRLASAQTSSGEDLGNLVPNLILTGITLPGNENPGFPHAGHFTLGNPTFGNSVAGAGGDTATIQAVEAFGDRFRAQFANFPLGSSTGGFTFTFDESTGLYTRSSASFGPAFTERATTIGRKKLSLGANYQHTSFDTFSGEDLSDGSITFYLPHTDCCSAAAPPPSPQNPGFEGDIMEAALTVKATTDTFAFFANYGITDNFDLGIAVPITRVDLEANVRARLIRLSSAQTPFVHSFENGRDVSEKIFSDSGAATGIGDIVVRSKYNFMRGANAGLAVAADLRLPTGNSDDLLGLGTTQAKIFFIASSTSDKLSPHVNLGFTISGQGKRETQFLFEPLGVSDEFNYAGGVEYVPHPRVTVLADFLGRTLFDAGKIDLETKTFPFRTGAATVGGATQTSSTNPLTGQPYQQLALQDGNLSLLWGSTGVKFAAATNFLVMAYVLFPLNSAGLRDNLTFAFGVDYAF